MEYTQIALVPQLEISKEGVVRRIANGRILSQYISSTGYYMISFRFPKGKTKPYRVHRLLAQTFIPNPSNAPCVNHIDGNKTNNHLDNLEWVTHQENMTHAFATGLANNTGERNGKSILNADKVRRIKELQGKMTQEQIAWRYGVSRSCIQGIFNGRLWKHI